MAGQDQSTSSSSTASIHKASLSSEQVQQWSQKHWATKPTGEASAGLDESLVRQIYETLSSSTLHELELSCYLENYLWPHFPLSGVSHAHLFSVLALINEKARQHMPVWESLVDDAARLGALFQALWPLADQLDALQPHERVVYITFLQTAFHSLENDHINRHILRMIGLPLWVHVPPTQRDKLLAPRPRLLKAWRQFEQQAARPAAKKAKGSTEASPSAPSSSREEDYPHEQHFFWTLLVHFRGFLTTQTGETDPTDMLYAEKFIEWCGDLLAQLPTRRFFRQVLSASFVLPAARLSSLGERSPMFQSLVERLTHYEHYAVDDFTGVALTRDEVTERHYERMQTVQVLAFKFFSPALRAFALRNVGAIEERGALQAQWQGLEEAELQRLAGMLGLVSWGDDGRPVDQPPIAHALLVEALLLQYARRPSWREGLVELPVYPHETLLWAPTVESAHACWGIRCAALPKLNLQFLTLYDYLERNYTLYQQETLHAIRQDLEDVVERLAPRQSASAPGSTVMTGWARMGAPLQRFALTSVVKPHLGETAPAHVHATLEMDLQPMRDDVRQEWRDIKPSDVLFLLQVVSPVAPGDTPDHTRPFPEAFGIRAVRGCTVLPRPRSKEGHEEERAAHKNNRLTLAVALDPHQYYVDMREDRDALYEEAHTLNVVVRREAKKNTFKGVLQSLRALMGEDSLVLPDWFQDVFLGYGDPSLATAQPMPDAWSWGDTFLDLPHLHEALGNTYALQVMPAEETTVNSSSSTQWEATYAGEVMQVRPVTPPRYSPYPQDAKAGNAIRFTPVQTQALMAGLKEGLTVIVGPPGTGKTDVAVQLLQLLYHNHPRQRTLLLTHSNQALNQLFEKLLTLPIEQRYLLRLGHGEAALTKTNPHTSFTQVGRVDALLARRTHLLRRVEQLARSLSESPDVAYSCETAHLFFLHTLQPLWAQFLRACTDDTSPDAIRVHFPFAAFFADVGEAPLFEEERARDEEQARVCYRYLTRLFEELEDIRPFELLRTTRERTQYLLLKQARIIAMTCTHAAMRREELAQWGFHVDNIVMEEAGQVLDLETFLPTLYGQPRAGSLHRLRRLVLLGDHHQLPPIVTNPLLQTHSRLDQSLFARLVRLGVPTIQLDQQGRSRPSLAALYRWQYQTLRDLPVVQEDARFQQANAGLVYEYQLVDVGDYHGQGESEPHPHFYQNLGEAEYVVALYQYLRLRGHPAASITLLTPYLGQKALLHDVVRQRCGHNAFGYPHKITTIDRYQGQQNDIVLLSLVRTKHVGHMRDARRLVVAMSRARLGLYVFGRWDVLAACAEWEPVMRWFTTRPRQLQLLPEENVPTTRPFDQHPAEATSVPDLLAMVALTQRMAQQRFSMPPLTGSQ